MEAVKSAERCQRNWNHSKPVIEEDVKKIVDVATTMPTKQNREYYELMVSTNPNFNRTCYKHAIDPQSEHFKDRKIHRNTQVTAPLVMIWKPTSPDDLFITDSDEFTQNYLISIGISSGAAVLTANQLGYKTGFCSCIEDETLFEDVEKIYNISVTNRFRTLIVGFGYPDENFDRQDCVIDGECGWIAESRNKNIDVKYIN